MRFVLAILKYFNSCALYAHKPAETNIDRSFRHCRIGWHLALLHWNITTVHLWNHTHDDVIKWKHFPRHWPFVRGIHRSPVSSPHKGQWRGALMFSLICVWINDWVNNREAGDLRRYRAHYDVTVMANVRYWYCDVTFVVCSYTRHKFVINLWITIVIIDFPPPDIYSVAWKNVWVLYRSIYGFSSWNYQHIEHTKQHTTKFYVPLKYIPHIYK